MKPETKELTYQQKQLLGWQLVGHVAAASDSALSVSMDYPGAGLYECLALTKVSDGSTFAMNLAGSNATILDGIWSKAKKDIIGTAQRLISKFGLDSCAPHSSINETLIQASRLISYHLELENNECSWGWGYVEDDFDLDNLKARSQELAQNFGLPSSWMPKADSGISWDWPKHLWILKKDSGIWAIINTHLGKLIYAHRPGTEVALSQALQDLYLERNDGQVASTQQITADVEEELKHYVYALVDPRNNEVFYVGKGQGERIFQHLKEADENPESQKQKLLRIQAIQQAGLDVKHFFIRTKIANETEAYAIEQAVIDAYKLSGHSLTNLVKGHHSDQVGLGLAEDVIAEVAAVPLGRFPVPMIMLNINQKWKVGVSDEELWEISREYWGPGDDARRFASHALMVAHGVIREIYRIQNWYQVETENGTPKWRFDGVPAADFAFLRGRQVHGFKKQGDAGSYNKLLEGYFPPTKP